MARRHAVTALIAIVPALIVLRGAWGLAQAISTGPTRYIAVVCIIATALLLDAWAVAAWMQGRPPKRRPAPRSAVRHPLPVPVAVAAPVAAPAVFVTVTDLPPVPRGLTR